MRITLISMVALLLAGDVMALDEPPFEVLSQSPDYEVRRYPAYLVAELEVRESFDEAGNKAFRPLADFIFGSNVGAENIGMTAPVTQRRERSGENIGMTAPVTQRSAEGEGYVVQFVMPSRYTLETLPRPTDERIRIREEPEKLVAVHRYSGTWSEGRYRKHEARLRAALERDGIAAKGEPTWARFNSPFSLWFLRRNEIWLPIDPASVALDSSLNVKK
jgi:hypothetical protein